MSSTNRGYERHKTDYYVTPKKAVEDFLDYFMPGDGRYLDPCAGGDSKHGMTYPEVIQEKLGIKVDTLDIREDSLAERKEDYLLAETKGYDVIITNPPFYLAKEIILKALRDVNEGGYVIMLLRLNFFGSNDRFEFFKENMPLCVFVHHRRFSFTDDKKTDSIEYMHAVWKKGTHPSYTQLRII